MISDGVQWPEDIIRVTELTQTEEKSARGRIEDLCYGPTSLSELELKKDINGGCKNN